ncbi:MAG: NADPH-dependent oxidoreductase, partial [Muribaculaceae bacterium]|nr:NADPH-dependent oxidoreductase [Muribaculaceae bacterium]
TERLPLHGIVHHETYQDYTAHDIDEIYAEKESLPVNQGFVKENNKQTLAQVFTDVRYPKAVNEEFAKRLYDYIKAAGYQI